MGKRQYEDLIFQKKMGILRTMHYPRYITKSTEDIKRVKTQLKGKKFLARLFLKHLILRNPDKISSQIGKKFF